jgi:hypothetical protein
MESRGVSVIVKYVGRASGGALYDKKTKRHAIMQKVIVETEIKIMQRINVLDLLQEIQVM